MKIRHILSCVVLFVTIQSAFGWGENLLVLDCEGRLHITSNFNLTATTIDFSFAKKLYDWYAQRVKARVQCACPGVTLSEDEFITYYWPANFAWIRNQLDGADGKFPESWPSSNNCAQNSFDVFKNWLRVHNDEFTFHFPASCSLDNWLDGQPCLMKMTPTAPVDINIQLAIDHCPNSYWPYISLSCGGAACNSFLKPCNGNGDCTGSLMCITLKNEDNEDLVSSENDWFEILQDMNLYDDLDNSPGCYPAKTVVTKIKQYLADLFPGNLNILPNIQIKMCSRESPDRPFEDTGLGIVSIFDLEKTCNGTERQGTDDYEDVQCSNIVTWNGILSSGGAANAPDRKTGAALPTDNINPVSPITSNARVLIKYSCDGQLSLIPNHQKLAVFFKNTHIAPAVNYLIGIIKEMQQCRRDGSLSNEAFEVRFAQVAGFLYQLTDPVTAINLGPDMSDWTFEDVDKRLRMPSTCTYSYWKANRQCKVSYSGFSELFNADIVLNAAISECPTKGLPEFYLECVGSGCTLLDKPVFCNSDANCPTGTVCKDANPAIENEDLPDLVAPWLFLDFEDDDDDCDWNNYDYCYFQRDNCFDNIQEWNQEASCQCMGQLVQCVAAFCPSEAWQQSYYCEQSGCSQYTQCYPVFTTTGTTGTTGNPNHPVCYGNKTDLFKKDMRAFMRWMDNQNDDGGTVNKYCFVDEDALPDGDTWADGQVTEDGDVLILVDLAAWNTQVPIPTGGSSSGGSTGTADTGTEEADNASFLVSSFVMIATALVALLNF